MVKESKKPKSNRERKAAFDKRMKNRGGADQTQPERWAMVFYLTRDAVDEVKRIREEARFEGSQPQRSAELFAEMLQVYLAWRRGEVLPMEGGGTRASLALDGVPTTRLSEDLKAFRASIELLRTTATSVDVFGDRLLGAHASERWTSFALLIDRLRSRYDRLKASVEEARHWHGEVEEYLELLLDRVERLEEDQVQLPRGRGRLFRRVLQDLER